MALGEDIWDDFTGKSAAEVQVAAAIRAADAQVRSGQIASQVQMNIMDRILQLNQPMVNARNIAIAKLLGPQAVASSVMGDRPGTAVVSPAGAGPLGPSPTNDGRIPRMPGSTGVWHPEGGTIDVRREDIGPDGEPLRYYRDPGGDRVPYLRKSQLPQTTSSAISSPPRGRGLVPAGSNIAQGVPGTAVGAGGVPTSAGSRSLARNPRPIDQDALEASLRRAEAGDPTPWDPSDGMVPGASGHAIADEFVVPELSPMEYTKLPADMGDTGMLFSGPGDYTKSPGYNFRLQEGLNQIENYLASRGQTNTPEAARALIEHGQNFATSDFDRHRARYFQDLNPLLSIMGAGQVAVGDIGSAGTQIGQGIAGAQLGQGAARGSGFINQSNAITGGQETGLNNIMQLVSLFS